MILIVLTFDHTIRSLAVVLVVVYDCREKNDCRDLYQTSERRACKTRNISRFSPRFIYLYFSFDASK